MDSSIVVNSLANSSIVVTPKHWNDGTPFWVVASLYNSDNSLLTFSQYYNLELLY